jgi:enamine deaminase RidA (YjgF/YER057c/UK114 family)
LTRLLLAIERLNPEALPAPETYSQVVTADGKRLVFVAGQVALDREGNLVGVQALARPEFLVEFEAIAVLEGSGGGQSPA